MIASDGVYLSHETCTHASPGTSCSANEIFALRNGFYPKVANYEVPDPFLGKLNISKGGQRNFTYALRFAAGFGSQVAFALFANMKNIKNIVYHKKVEFEILSSGESGIYQ